MPSPHPDSSAEPATPRDPLDHELDRLFREPAASFVAARNALAQSLKQAGRRDEATEIQKLSKPTPIAWTVNRLHFEARELLEELRRAGKALRQAQESSAPPDEFAARQREHHGALRKASERAASIADEAGLRLSADQKRRLDSNLKLLSAAEDVRPPPGRMTAELSPLGFDALSLDAPLSPPPRPSRTEKEDPERAARLGAVRSALEAAEREARRLSREAEIAESAFSRAARDVADAEARAEATRVARDAARASADEARARAEAAAHAVDEARLAIEEIENPGS